MSTDSLQWLHLVNHYCFRGRRDLSRDFRAVAVTSPSDISADESFDLIVCNGLHHQDDPGESLRQLRARLRPGGAVGLSLVSRYGRPTVSRIQTLLKLLNVGVDDRSEMVRNSLDVLRQMRSNGISAQIPSTADGLYALYLRPVEHTYTVLEIYQLLEGAGLNFVDFAPEFHPYYDPAYTFAGPALERVMALPVPLQQAAADMFWGMVPEHRFWASTETGTIADPFDRDNVPFFTAVGKIDANSLRSAFLAIPIGRSQSVTLSRPGGAPAQLSIEVDERAHALVELIDGRRTMGEIAREMARKFNAPEEEMLQWSGAVLDSFRSYDVILLRSRTLTASA